MKIQTIEIRNYKAFYGSHKIAIGQKNVFIYGENGSGKSSFYYALKDFVQSSMEDDIRIQDLENVFIPTGEKGKVEIAVSFKPDLTGDNRKTEKYTFNSATNTAKSGTDTTIKDAYQLKSFLTYKHLLDIHHIRKDQEINLFNLLVNGVLKHFKYALTNGKELGQMWQDIQALLGRETDRTFTNRQKAKEVQNALDEFNKAFGQLFIPPTTASPNPEYILDHALPILHEFNHGLEISLQFSGVKPNPESDKAISNDKVSISLKYGGQVIDKPHLFLNEARLSAIAISIYLGMIKRHPQLKKFKILFLDDIFIGLDISNRLPLLKILETHFADYQVFISTYDKPWYEYVKAFLESSGNWKTIEFYAQEMNGGYEIPKVDDKTDFIQKAKAHYANSDYKASAVYARSAFERILMNYCEKKRKKLVFKTRKKDYSSEDFWKVIKDDLQPATKINIEQYRFLIYNPLSHYDPEINPVKAELSAAIAEVENLSNELNALT